jgi:DNA polymerase III epsilon subunit-like protein
MRNEGTSKLFAGWLLGMPIKIDAMTVRHITNEMVQDKPTFRDSDTWKQLRDLIAPNTNVMVAHNAAFDIGHAEKRRDRA